MGEYKWMQHASVCLDASIAVCVCVGGDQLLLASNGKSGRGVFCRRWRRASGSGIGGGGGGEERQGWKQSLASINRVGLLPW